MSPGLGQNNWLGLADNLCGRRFGLAPFAGPALAPAVAGYIAVSGTSWRWVYWLLCFFASACGLLGESVMMVAIVLVAERD